MFVINVVVLEVLIIIYILGVSRCLEILIIFLVLMLLFIICVWL